MFQGDVEMSGKDGPGAVQTGISVSKIYCNPFFSLLLSVIHLLATSSYQKRRWQQSERETWK